MNPPLPPGTILLENYLKPMGISQNAMARAIGVPPGAINAIILGKRAITPAMSVRFGVFFGHYEDYWHSLQVECDFFELRQQSEQLTDNILTAKAVCAVSS